VRRELTAPAQGVSLLHAEAVLLVDDDKAEVGEPDVVLDQGVGADDDPGRAGLDVEQRLAPGLGAERTGEQRDGGGLLGAVELTAAPERAQQGA
jgi:hypothetical protein